MVESDQPAAIRAHYLKDRKEMAHRSGPASETGSLFEGSGIPGAILGDQDRQ